MELGIIEAVSLPVPSSNSVLALFVVYMCPNYFVKGKRTVTKCKNFKLGN